MRPTDKATADSRSVQSFAIIKNAGHGLLLLAVFTLELEMDYPSETSLCTVPPPPSRQTAPCPIFSEGRGRERIIPSSNCPSKLTDKVRRIVHSNLKIFHFQIKRYYLSDVNHQDHDVTTQIWSKMQILEGYAEFESFCLNCAAS